MLFTGPVRQSRAETVVIRRMIPSIFQSQGQVLAGTGDPKSDPGAQARAGPSAPHRVRRRSPLSWGVGIGCVSVLKSLSGRPCNELLNFETRRGQFNSNWIAS